MLCYIILTFGKWFPSSSIWYYFTLGERGAQTGFAKLAMSVLEFGRGSFLFSSQAAFGMLNS